MSNEKSAITLCVYRHKTEKDIYLARNWNICGGGESTDFYYATKNISTAIDHANKEGFLSWLRSFPTLTAKITLQKQMDFDGYAGTLSKTASLPVSDFEKITLTEK